MEAAWKQLIWSQFGAAIDTLGNAIKACPVEVWGDRTQRPEFWHLAFHTLFFLDLYLSESPKGFAPPAPFSLSEMDPSGKLPDRVYSKEEILAYVAYGRAKCRRVVAASTDDDLHRQCAFGWVGVTAVELFLYGIRHVQHHAAQLNLVLRQRTNSAPGWVFKANESLD